VVAGKYEKPPGSYKHFYFNCTYNTLAIWLVVLIGFVLLYESVRCLVPLVCYNRRLLRYEMLALFASSLYSHFYAWWATINYINDDFYEQWGHQVRMFYSSASLAYRTVGQKLSVRLSSCVSQRSLAGSRGGKGTPVNGKNSTESRVKAVQYNTIQ